MSRVKHFPLKHVTVNQSSAAKKRKKRRYKPGTVALKEIRHYQKTTNLFIPKKSFTKLSQEITRTIKSTMRISPEAITALQTAAEIYLTNLFTNANLCAIYAHRSTIMVQDMQAVNKMYTP